MIPKLNLPIEILMTIVQIIILKIVTKISHNLKTVKFWRINNKK